MINNYYIIIKIKQYVSNVTLQMVGTSLLKGRTTGLIKFIILICVSACVLIVV